MTSAKWQNKQLQDHIPPQKLQKTSKSCKNQPCQNSGNRQKIYSIQKNVESRKKQIGGKFCALLLALNSPHPQLSDNLEDPFPVRDTGPWLQKRKSSLYPQINLCICFTLSGDSLKYWYKVLISVSPSAKLTWGGIATCSAQKHCEANKLPAVTWGKRL